MGGKLTEIINALSGSLETKSGTEHGRGDDVKEIGSSWNTLTVSIVDSNGETHFAG